MKGRSYRLTVPDEMVIAIRRAYEIDRKPMRKVYAAFPSVSAGYIYRILTYRVRAHLKVES